MASTGGAKRVNAESSAKPNHFFGGGGGNAGFLTQRNWYKVTLFGSIRLCLYLFVNKTNIVKSQMLRRQKETKLGGAAS